MTWFKRILLVIVVLVAVLAIAPLFISLDDFRPQVERAVVDKLKEPVRLKKLRLVGLPLPHVLVEGIEVGKSGEVKVGTVKVSPNLLSLLSSTKVIRSILITGFRACGRSPGCAPPRPGSRAA